MNKNNYTIGIVGHGFVGRAVSLLFSNENCISNEQNYAYDPFIEDLKENKHKALNSDFVFLCVPTPSLESGELDTSIIQEYIVEHNNVCTNKNSIMIIKSTIPPGTCDKIQKLTNFPIIHNPEFLTERTHVKDFKNPIDVIIGKSNIPYTVSFRGNLIEPHVALSSVYREFYLSLQLSGETNKIPSFVYRTNTAAEIIKTSRNSFYSLKISFMNDIYDLCKALDQDYEEIRSGITFNGNHPWWCDMHTHVPGPDGSFGYGGKCFPKDSKGLLFAANSNGIDMKTLKSSIESNNERRSK